MTTVKPIKIAERTYENLTDLVARKAKLEENICIPSFKGPQLKEYINKYAVSRPNDVELQEYKNIFNYFA